MKVNKQDIKKGQRELIVELSVDEFKPYIEQGSQKVSKEIKIDGFRSGKIPYEVLKQKIGEMTILEESARIAINKTLDKAIQEIGTGKLIGQPRVDIVKLAPNNPLEYKITIALIPEITLGAYKDLKIKQAKIKIDEEEMKRTMKELRESRVKEILSEGEAKKGDKLLVNIQMFHDKVPLENGQAQDTAVILGEDRLVPGFDKQLIKAKKGEKKEFSLPYPKDHFMKNVAGKIVDFKVEVKEIYERVLPKLDDELAKGFGLKNIKELEEAIKKSVTQQKEQDQSRQIEKEMLEKIMNETKFGDIPEMLVEQEGKNMLAELKQGIIEQGGKFEDYLKSLNKTEAELTLDLLPDAVKRVKASLLIREIANKEKITVKPEEIEHHIKHMKQHYQDKPDILARLDGVEYRNYVINVETSRKVVDKLLKWNIAKE